MAIYHMSMKTISRSSGRSATGAAAYRAGAEIADTRTGEVHDYTRRGGVEGMSLHLPDGAPAWAQERAELWNRAEASERRRNSTVAREVVIALPSELDAEARTALAYDFAREIVARHGCAVDVAIHAPGKQGDQRNHHAHLLMTTRRLDADGFTAKTRELDDRKRGRGEVKHWRARWAELSNAALERAGRPERVDHRSLEAQGIERAPTTHRGPGATAHERATGEASRRQDHEAEARRAAEIEAGELREQAGAIEARVIDLEEARAALKARRDLPVEPDRLSSPGPDASPVPAPERSPAALARAERKRERAATDQAMLGRIHDGQAPALRGHLIATLAKHRQERGQRLRARLAEAWRRLDERRRAWIEAAPGRLRRLLGSRSALQAREVGGKALERRERDLERRGAVVERETRPQRAHDWAQALVSLYYPKLTARAEAERKERIKQADRNLDQGQQRDRGRGGRGR